MISSPPCSDEYRDAPWSFASGPSRLPDAVLASAGFYIAPVAPGHRSVTNVRFHLTGENLTERFVVEALIRFMTDFARRYG